MCLYNALYKFEVQCYSASNAAMQLKYAMESLSIAMPNYHCWESHGSYELDCSILWNNTRLLIMKQVSPSAATCSMLIPVACASINILGHM